jgi:hypothetical protein
MDHNDIRHMLSEYIDDAVSPGDRAAIEEHLKTCEKCTNALKELRQTVAVIRSVEEIDPPAWMTQKIMAKVRTEAGSKSWFQRLFFPLAVKLPLEAIGALFIAVTAVFIYQNMQPSAKMKAPTQQAVEQAPAQEPAVIAKNEETLSAAPARRAKEMPQSPGYNALDMKQEYEKPAPPTLQDRAAAPAPPLAKPAEQPAPLVQSETKQSFKAESEGRMNLLSKEAAPARGMMQERMASSGAAPETNVKAKKSARAAAFADAPAADKAVRAIIVQVNDIEAAAKEAEKAIAQVNGAIIKRESPGEKRVFFLTIKTQRVSEFKNSLKVLGEIKELPGEVGIQKEQMELRVEIVRKAAQP